MQRPGLLHGRMLRPPRYGAELAAVDSAEAQKAAGVTVVRDGDFVGVLASTTEDAAKAASLVKCTWTGGGDQSAATLFDVLRKTANAGSGSPAGDVDAARASAAARFEATYTVAYIAHCPLSRAPRWRSGTETS